MREEPERYPAWPSIEKSLEAKRELERSSLYYRSLPVPASTEGEVKLNARSPIVSRYDARRDSVVTRVACVMKREHVPPRIGACPFSCSSTKTPCCILRAKCRARFAL